MSTPTKEALANLCEALGNTYWSSWQTTGKFWSQLEAANAVIASERIRDAAPELLEALTDCVEHMHWTQPQGEAALKKAKAAIAKATGEQA